MKLAICVVFALSVLLVNGASILRYEGNDRGVAKNCGPRTDNFTITWEPRMIVWGGTYTFHVDFPLLDDLPEGTLIVEGWVEDIVEPVVREQIIFTCGDVGPVVGLPCPMKKGQRLILDTTMVLAPSQPFPTGDYRLRARVENNLGHLIICAEANVSVA